MARITVEDCLQKVNNRFALIHMAAKRVRQLRKGAEPTLSSKNKDVVVSLREIASGHVKKAVPRAPESLLDSPPDSLAEGLLADEATRAENEEAVAESGEANANTAVEKDEKPE